MTGQMTTEAPPFRCQTGRMASREPGGMHEGRERELQFSQSTRANKETSDQENCIAGQNPWSRSPCFNMQINPCLQCNHEPKTKAHASSFSSQFVCKCSTDTASLNKLRLHRHTRKYLCPKHRGFFSSICTKRAYVHSLKVRRETAKIHGSQSYLQNKLLRSFHGQSLGDP